MKICEKCKKDYEDNLVKCPFCNHIPKKEPTDIFRSALSLFDDDEIIADEKIINEKNQKKDEIKESKQEQINLPNIKEPIKNKNGIEIAELDFNFDELYIPKKESVNLKKSNESPKIQSENKISEKEEEFIFEKEVVKEEKEKKEVKILPFITDFEIVEESKNNSLKTIPSEILPEKEEIKEVKFELNKEIKKEVKDLIKKEPVKENKEEKKAPETDFVLSVQNKTEEKKEMKSIEDKFSMIEKAFQEKPAENIKNEKIIKEKKIDNVKVENNSTLQRNKNILTSENLSLKQSNYYKVMGFIKRIFFSLIDQSIIFFVSYIYLTKFIEINQVENNFIHVEYWAYFIMQNKEQITHCFIFYMIFSFFYYSIFNILFYSTPSMIIFKYKLYNYSGDTPNLFILLLRNMVLIPVNLMFILFPFLFIFLSDFKQTLYDKLFKVYILKKIK